MPSPLTSISSLQTPAFRGRVLGWLLELPLIVIVGGMCYTTYLYHFYLISIFGRFTLPWTEGLPFAAALLVQACLIVIPTLVACAVLFKLTERPFMSWRLDKPKNQSKAVRPLDLSMEGEG